jgi:hypothetical protein
MKEHISEENAKQEINVECSVWDLEDKSSSCE